MNRIVIIGNGFDLAQGLKTSYEDFLLDYFKNEVKKKIENPVHESDKLFQVIEQNTDSRFFSEKIEKIKDLLQFKSEVKIDLGHIESAFFYPNLNQKKIEKWSQYIEIRTKSIFFKNLIDKENWTDIEKFYFEELISKFKEHRNDKEQLKREVIELNQDFEHLKLKLVEYLKKINKNPSFMDWQEKEDFTIFEKCLKEPINQLNYFNLKADRIQTHKESYLKNVCFLNFNYTNTINSLIEHSFENCFQIHIHGNLENLDSIIFGFGDESSNDKYKELEDADIRELLENFKSIHYPKTKQYNDLMNIMESDVFDVIVLGHSMGLSDRVLLESIFENENCKAIRLFHRGSLRSFENKVIAISRHFKDKQKMRRKIVSYNPNDVLGDPKK